MTGRHPRPGVSRQQRLSEEGLQRLERQLTSSSGISDAVLAQWIKRYGNAARTLIRRHGRSCPVDMS
ncbi:hypothetical protein [Thiolapillus brandeum]|uniref:Uncharacterized protein n=1 Tax=Thiolapillus brandeum TaxID=1076588 RepID=A0A7U6JGH5_9GAMM|nr:hypothetical protein [Thiolapillus brandeum]BAO43614.1 hypothetical protein TBH_C0676 [Thiolapillus brandeum]